MNKHASPHQPLNGRVPAGSGGILAKNISTAIQNSSPLASIRWRKSCPLRRISGHVYLLLLILGLRMASADIGDPQIRTDDPWYPGELACSTFGRLFATEA